MVRLRTRARTASDGLVWDYRSHTLLISDAGACIHAEFARLPALLNLIMSVSHQGAEIECESGGFSVGYR